MIKRCYVLLLLLTAALIIGCGGDGGLGDGFTDGTTSTATTNGSTDGNTTGDVSRFAGNYDGELQGSNTQGAQFAGEGFADIETNGDATFWFDAFIGNVLYSRTFEGEINAAGEFDGFTHTGERATGTVTRDGNTLRATIVWVKRTLTGQVFSTETEHFTVFRL